MTEITLLRTKDKFMCKCDTMDIYNYIIDDGFIIVPTIDGYKLVLSKNEPILCKEVK